MSFFKKIGHGLGKFTHYTLAPITYGTKGVGKLAGHIPVVGKGIRASINLVGTPFVMADNIANGARIDRAALNSMKAQLHDIKDIAPYAKVIIGMVPGIGTGVNAAIATGVALADGKRIDQALLSSIRDNLPPGAQQIFDQGVQLSASANDNRAQMDATLTSLPPEQKNAFQTAMALGQAQKLQGNITQAAASPGTVLTLTSVAAQVLPTDPILQSGDLVLSFNPDIQHGYQVGIGTFSHGDVGQAAMDGIKAGLTPPQMVGFNIALAVHLGMLNTSPPVDLPPREQFGYLAVYGMEKASPDEKSAMLDAVSHDNSARNGVTRAISELKETGFWPKVKHYVAKHFHIHHRAPV